MIVLSLHLPSLIVCSDPRSVALLISIPAKPPGNPNPQRTAQHPDIDHIGFQQCRDSKASFTYGLVQQAGKHANTVPSCASHYLGVFDLLLWRIQAVVFITHSSISITSHTNLCWNSLVSLCDRALTDPFLLLNNIYKASRKLLDVTNIVDEGESFTICFANLTRSIEKCYNVSTQTHFKSVSLYLAKISSDHCHLVIPPPPSVLCFMQSKDSATQTE